MKKTANKYKEQSLDKKFLLRENLKAEDVVQCEDIKKSKTKADLRALALNMCHTARDEKQTQEKKEQEKREQEKQAQAQQQELEEQARLLKQKELEEKLKQQLRLGAVIAPHRDLFDEVDQSYPKKNKKPSLKLGVSGFYHQKKAIFISPI